MSTKICPKCQQPKSVFDFYWQHKQHRPLAYCKTCHKKYTKTYQQKPQHKIKLTENLKRYRQNNRRRIWATKTLSEHRRRGCQFNFDVQELMTKAEQNSLCEFCQQPIIWNNTKIMDNSPTLERLHNQLTTNNISEIAIVCFKCNKSKQNRSLEEYIHYLEQLLPRLKTILS